MQKGDVIRARFMTLPDLFPGKGCEEKKFPIRKGTVVYVHPKGRYIVAECGGVRGAAQLRRQAGTLQTLDDVKRLAEEVLRTAGEQ